MKKKLFLVFFLLCSSLVFFIGSEVWEKMGPYPTKQEFLSFHISPQFNKGKNIFENRLPHVFKEMRKKSFDWKLIKEWFTNDVDQVPPKKLPEIKPSLENFMKKSDSVKVIWLGHSTLLLNFGGKIILIDPIFSQAASPIKYFVKRFQEPVLRISDIPSIDMVVISHDHYDHLDFDTIQLLKNKTKNFIVPLGVGVYLRGWGVRSEKIIEKYWWEEVEVESIKFICTPAQHFSGRSGIINNKTLWASWVIRNQSHNIYYSGDSGYDIHFKEIGEKYGPFDLAFMENGQYNLKWRAVHLLPFEGAKALQDLRAKIYFPIHWGMFDLALHAWNEPANRIYKLSQQENFDIVIPKLGEQYEIGQEYQQFDWWNF